MKLKYDMTIMDIDGDKMAVPTGSNDAFHGLLHMNGTTADIIEILKNDVTVDEIVSTLKKEYDATEEQITRSVLKVINILREHNLIIE